MNNNIVCLDGKTATYIDSTQVIRNIIDIVRELIENSIDSGATIIKVELSQDWVEVCDNGSGIKNVEQLGLYSATSKISTIDDLENLNTIGFRGEALRSLCCVAGYIEIDTACQGDQVGARYIFSESGFQLDADIVMQKGTRVYIERVFEAIPVRYQEAQRKYRRDLADIVLLLQKFAIVRGDISFTLIEYKKPAVLPLYNKENSTQSDQSIMLYGTMRNLYQKRVLFSSITGISSWERRIEMYFYDGKFPSNTINTKIDLSELLETECELDLLLNSQRAILSNNLSSSKPVKTQRIVSVWSINNKCVDDIAEISTAIKRLFVKYQNPMWLLCGQLKCNKEMVQWNLEKDKGRVILSGIGTIIDEVVKNVSSILESRCAMMYESIKSNHSEGIRSIFNFRETNQNSINEDEPYICTNPRMKFPHNTVEQSRSIRPFSWTDTATISDQEFQRGLTNSYESNIYNKEQDLNTLDDNKSNTIIDLICTSYNTEKDLSNDFLSISEENSSNVLKHTRSNISEHVLSSSEKYFIEQSPNSNSEKSNFSDLLGLASIDISKNNLMIETNNDLIYDLSGIISKASFDKHDKLNGINSDKHNIDTAQEPDLTESKKCSKNTTSDDIINTLNKSDIRQNVNLFHTHNETNFSNNITPTCTLIKNDYNPSKDQENFISEISLNNEKDEQLDLNKEAEAVQASLSKIFDGVKNYDILKSQSEEKNEFISYGPRNSYNRNTEDTISLISIICPKQINENKDTISCKTNYTDDFISTDSDYIGMSPESKMFSAQYENSNSLQSLMCEVIEEKHNSNVALNNKIEQTDLTDQISLSRIIGEQFPNPQKRGLNTDTDSHKKEAHESSVYRLKKQIYNKNLELNNLDFFCENIDKNSHIKPISNCYDDSLIDHVDGCDKTLSSDINTISPENIKELKEVKTIKRQYLEFRKSDFFNLIIRGNFNKGFILATLDKNNSTHLYLIDQHAADEKFRFEGMARASEPIVIKRVKPLNLNLTMPEEAIVLEHENYFIKNGFHFTYDETLEPGKRISLTTTSFLAGVALDESDFLDLLDCCSMLDNSNASFDRYFLPGPFDDLPIERDCLKSFNAILPRPQKVWKRLASKACRTAIMFGDIISREKMQQVLTNLSHCDQPWNCPHGRPTMQHAIEIDVCLYDWF